MPSEKLEPLAWRIEWNGDGGWKEYDTVSKDPTEDYEDRVNFRVIPLCATLSQQGEVERTCGKCQLVPPIARFGTERYCKFCVMDILPPIGEDATEEERITRSRKGFHVRDGWHFRREDNGDIRVHYGERDKVGITLTPDDWWSILKYLAPTPESPDTRDREAMEKLDEAVGLHQGIEVTYLVDCYEAALTNHDGATTTCCAHGPTIQQAILNLSNTLLSQTGEDEV